MDCGRSLVVGLSTAIDKPASIMLAIERGPAPPFTASDIPNRASPTSTGRDDSFPMAWRPCSMGGLRQVLSADRLGSGGWQFGRSRFPAAHSWRQAIRLPTWSGPGRITFAAVSCNVQGAQGRIIAHLVILGTDEPQLLTRSKINLQETDIRGATWSSDGGCRVNSGVFNDLDQDETMVLSLSVVLRFR